MRRVEEERGGKGSEGREGEGKERTTDVIF